VPSFQPDFIVDSGDMTTHMRIESLDAYLRQSQTRSPNTFLLPTYSNHHVWVYAGRESSSRTSSVFQTATAAADAGRWPPVRRATPLQTGHLPFSERSDYSTAGGPPFVASDGTPLTSASLLQVETELLRCGNGTNPNEVFDVSAVSASAGGGTAPHFLAVGVNGDTLTARFVSPQWRYGLKPVGQEDNATGCFMINKATDQLCTCSPGWHSRGRGAWPGGLALGPGTEQTPRCISLSP
jgi:hypothetical protein